MVEVISGTAQELHDLDLHERRGERLIDVVELVPTSPAVVLGSTQQLDIVDVEAARDAGFAVARRRSGGGIVVVDSSTARWLDITIGREHPMWDDDVVRASKWVGDAWRRAVIGTAPTGTAPTVGVAPAGTAPTVGVASATDRRRDGSVLCFWGLGPGEVTISGAKLVGLSQRRTRDGARFQCQFHTAWRPRDWVHLIRPLAEPMADTDWPAVATLPPSLAPAVIADFIEDVLAHF